jgi:hypothetical protein
VRRGTTDGGVKSEFAGVPPAEQQRLIAEGGEQLGDVFGGRVPGFVPPWNTYDRATLEACGATGVDFVSAGAEPPQFGTLPVVPTTCSLRNARQVAERAFYFQSLAPLLVVVFHPDDFEEFRLPPRPDEPPPHTNLARLESLLAWIKSAPSVETSGLGRIAQSMRHGSPLRRPDDMNLPYRVKAMVPPILARASSWGMMTGVLLGTLRGQLARG